ncbi:hypothetical protein COU61_01935 [Candidatus Pacearchaeota archaeon CG10_big_fil_rev_8_21_14_0_10_35_13]|nr:MAG: hypothetical protein COU61_01935 [Candidatus Pacearchaeota archaeon CG10_big_fil_rev_8_21_14_0_10_35_13]
MVVGTIYDWEIHDYEITGGCWKRIPGERQRDGLYGEYEPPAPAGATSVRRPVTGIDTEITSDC